MNSQIGFIAKILLLSTLVSILIKYGGQRLTGFYPLAPSVSNALIAVLVLPITITAILGWRVAKKIK